ncbi:hypothetical protein Ddye_020099 [Dipteronia dyeriana]|uniref:Uncharacterized protein n=1 Tax=Dipteronia dyeriana TaxID=168575 RepID=A0AAD9TYZ8_9ROSI|nr:hypothetical protein Ddye_020099 [Dipteronia dyeriana]
MPKTRSDSSMRRYKHCHQSTPNFRHGNYAIICCGAIKGLIEREEKEKNLRLLMGSNESYATMRGSILMMSPLPDTHKVHALVLQFLLMRYAYRVKSFHASSDIFYGSHVWYEIPSIAVRVPCERSSTNWYLRFSPENLLNPLKDVLRMERA